jgi:hypothetical protein
MTHTFRVYHNGVLAVTSVRPPLTCSEADREALATVEAAIRSMPGRVAFTVSEGNIETVLMTKAASA